MIPKDAVKQWREIQAAETYRDQYLKGTEELHRQYYGANYKGVRAEMGSSLPVLNTHAFDYVSQMLPELVWDHPRCRPMTESGGPVFDMANLLCQSVNQVAERRGFRNVFLRTALDFQFGFGVQATGRKPMPGRESEWRRGKRVPMWPGVARISPRRFVIDVAGDSPESARFMAHTELMDKDSLLIRAKARPEEGWNVQAITETPTGIGGDKLREKTSAIPDRGEILVYHLWVPEHQAEADKGPEDGFHGTLYTLAAGATKEDGGQGVWLRKPRGFFGPPTGPYSWFGQLPVMDEVFPLTTLMATREAAADLNAQMIAASTAAKNYKRLIICSADNPQLMAMLQNPTDFVIKVPGFKKDEVVAVEIGGITQQQMVQMEYFSAQQDRISGMDDAQRGVAEGDATATESAIADARAGSRRGFVRRQFTDSVKMTMTACAWFCYHDDQFLMEFGGDDAKALRERGAPTVQSIEFRGGLQQGEESLWDQVANQISIEPYSMQYRSEQDEERRYDKWLNTIATLAPLIPTLPFVDWIRVFRDMGQRMGVPQASSYVDVEMALKLVQAGYPFAPPAQAAQPSRPSGGAQRPRQGPGQQAKPQQRMPGGGGQSSQKPQQTGMGGGGMGPRTPVAAAPRVA
jgi:hypothetical protein